MKAVVLSFTRNGAKLSLVLKEVLRQQGYEVETYAPKAYSGAGSGHHDYDPGLNRIVQEAFASCPLLVFIGACGIAVRAVAPFVRAKQADPAVICLDEKGTYAIPLLSGHIGGANRLALIIGEKIGAQPVITTATDLHGLPAVDQWAAKRNLHIGDWQAAKKISAHLLEGKTVGLDSDFEITGELPPAILTARQGPVGICISLDGAKKPYEITLNLVPKIVHLGLGCRQNTTLEALEEAVFAVLQPKNISPQAIAGIATIDLKSKELGLIEFAAKYQLPLTFFSAQELDGLDGEFTGSAFVKRVTGVDNVCERAAVLASDHGRLLVRKKALNGVSVALAQKSWRVYFED